MTDHAWRTADLVTTLGVTRRQLEYWQHAGYIGMQHTGTGNARRWTPDEAAVIAMIVELTDLGYDAGTAAHIARTLSGPTTRTITRETSLLRVQITRRPADEAA